MGRKTIAIDMDNVMSDDEAQYIKWYEQESGVLIDKAYMKGRPEKEALPDKTAVERYLQTPGFFTTIPVMPGAIEAIRKLQERYEIYVVTSAFDYPHSLTEKYQWLKTFFPFIEDKFLVFCGDKSIIDTDYLIDDKVSNLESCQAEGLLFTAGHNINESYPRRLNNWEDVIRYFCK